MDIDVGKQLTEEQIKKIKEAALKRADEAREEVNDMGDKATAEEAKEAVPVQRTVFLDKKVDLLVYDGDKVVNTLHPDRNILEICLVLKSIDKDTIVSIYGKEGPGSDPLPEGQDDPLYPIFDIVKKPVAEAMKLLVTNMVAEDVCLTEYQRLCDFMSFRSSLKACISRTLSSWLRTAIRMYCFPSNPCLSEQSRSKTLYFFSIVSTSRLAF